MAYSCLYKTQNDIPGLLEKQTNKKTPVLIASYECFKKEDYEFSYTPPDFQSYTVYDVPLSLAEMEKFKCEHGLGSEKALY